MKKTRLMFAAISCSAIMACSTMEAQVAERPLPSGESCQSASLEQLVGIRANAEIGANALIQSGAETLRWIPPRSAVTMDYRHDRLNIEYDDDLVITRIHCG
ncbi:I78 family peptidase inhibitor [Parasphingorhabdus sp. JC815]|uniref:I78 family peptidase inhibitor n=1 Tax=Parasphingorhabdus sp. JC815 TaxID=3232140 RepID=UPI003459ABED